MEKQATEMKRGCPQPPAHLWELDKTIKGRV